MVTEATPGPTRPTCPQVPQEPVEPKVLMQAPKEAWASPGPGGALFAAGPQVCAFPRAQAFLGRPLEDVALPNVGDPVDCDVAKRLVEKRCVDTVLRWLATEEETPANPEVSVMRLQCLVALRRHAEAAAEAARIISLRGDESPFQVRLQAAHLPFILLRSSTSGAADAAPILARLRDLARSEPLPKDSSAEESLRNRLAALRVLSHVAIAAGHPDFATAEILVSVTLVEEAGAGMGRMAAQVRALLGRHLVAIGDVDAAAEAFKRAHEAFPADAPIVGIDLGLLAIANGEHAAAKAHFSTAIDALARGVESPGGDREDETVTAENNLVVCCLYLKELNHGIERLEALIRRDPVAYLRPSTARNLAALYEFVPDTANRRTALRELVYALHLEDTDPKVFEPSGA